MTPHFTDPGRDGLNARNLETLVHDLAQHLHIVVTSIAAIERREGERHADLLEPAKRALTKLDRGMEALAALVRESRSARD